MTSQVVHYDGNRLVHFKEIRQLFLKTIKPVSFNLEGASFLKEGPMFTIVAERPGELFAFYWITINLETGELFITDVKDFHDECDRQGLESANII